MTNLTPDALTNIIEKHEKYLKNRIKNQKDRADLSEANLSGAYLSDANLRDANLRDANLSGAYLSDANLRDAYLSGADLRGADLRDANLSGAYLSGADLRDADLRSANLRGADLSSADLSGVYLSEANLRDAYLSGADLRGAISYQVPPSCGAFIGWKKVRDNLIVKLMILEDAKRSSAFGRKCRCDKALVLDIQKINCESSNTSIAVSKYKKSFKYEIGKIVKVDDFNDNRFEECASGIHFFITRDEAVNY